MRLRMSGVFFGLVLAAIVANAAPPEAPPKVDTAPGDLVQFTVKVEKGKKLGWETGFDPLTDCEVYRLHSDDPDVYVFLLRPKRIGTFYFVSWTVGDEGAKGARTLINAGGGGGGEIDDPLVTKLRAAYKAENDPNKAEQMTALAHVYAEAALACDDLNHKTYGDLFAAMSKTAIDNKVNGKLAGVQGVISAELKVVLPVKTQDQIFFADRAKARAIFTKMSKAITEAAK